MFGKLCDSASFRQSFADAEAKYRAARAFVYSAWDALSERVAKGEKPNLEEIALIRLAMRHLHNVISDLSTFAHRAARGASLRPSQLQRCYRDIHAGTQHILLADEIMQECGKVLLGATGARRALDHVRGQGLRRCATLRRARQAHYFLNSRRR